MGLLIEWSPEATEDLELIAEYIARDSLERVYNRQFRPEKCTENS